MFSKDFWKATAERAVRAFGASAGSSLIAGTTNIVSMPWLSAIEVGAGAAAISVLLSLAAVKISGGGPSMTNAEQLPPK